MERSRELSEAHKIYLSRSSGSGWILIALTILAGLYLLAAAGGTIGQAVVVAVIIGSLIQGGRTLLTRSSIRR